MAGNRLKHGKLIHRSESNNCAEDLNLKQENLNLRKSLQINKINQRLYSIIDLALLSVNQNPKTPQYIPMSEIMNDGFEISLGCVSFETALASKNALIDLIHRDSDSLTVKNVLFRNRLDGLRMWVTLNDSCSQLSRGLITRMVTAQQRVKKFALENWLNDDQGLSNIRITKVDFCIDLEGSFIPLNESKLHKDLGWCLE